MQEEQVIFKILLKRDIYEYYNNTQDIEKTISYINKNYSDINFSTRDFNNYVILTKKEQTTYCFKREEYNIKREEFEKGLKENGYINCTFKYESKMYI